MLFCVGGARVSRGEAAILNLGSGSTCLTVAASQSTLCCVFHACTAMPFFKSFLITAPLCSLSLFSSVLPVSPMYTQLQSAQGTWYTTLFSYLSHTSRPQETPQTPLPEAQDQPTLHLSYVKGVSVRIE